MCGITGAVSLAPGSGHPVARQTLEAMMEVVRHRGPNDVGSFVDDGVALGVRRLSIIDVEGGHQPFANESGDIVAIQNGELYNHVELRKRLVDRRHRLCSVCDTEVIPHLYEERPDDFETQLRGMFGIAVWDRRRRRTTLVRDRLGIKPLYYAVAGDVLVFGSELKSVLASGLVEPSVDDESVGIYLALGYVPAPRTIFAGVHKLLPGERLVADEQGVRVSRYWRVPMPTAVSRRPIPAWREELLERLEEAVRLRLMSDVPLGAMLSGGLDSSLVVALMARHSSGPVMTFSVGFAEAGPAGELPVARSVAEAFSTDHHELELSIHDTVELEELVYHLDEPIADLSTLGFHALCELASRHVTVALSGQGADEMLGGYERYRNASLAEVWDRIPLVRRPAAVLLSRISPRLARGIAVLREGDPDDRLLRMSRRIPSELERELRGHRAGDGALRAVKAATDAFHGPLAARAMLADAQLSLPDDMLHYFDRGSMAHSLEVRVPFLDHELVEFCATIPTDLKIRRLTTKYLLKDAAEQLLPQEIVHRKKVGFFNPVVAAWFEGQADGAVRNYLLAPELAAEAHVDASRVRRLVETHLAHPTRSTGDAVLTLLMLEVWLRSYTRLVRERAPTAAASVRVA